MMRISKVSVELDIVNEKTNLNSLAKITNGAYQEVFSVNILCRFLI